MAFFKNVGSLFSRNSWDALFAEAKQSEELVGRLMASLSFGKSASNIRLEHKEYLRVLSGFLFELMRYIGQREHYQNRKTLFVVVRDYVPRFESNLKMLDPSEHGSLLYMLNYYKAALRPSLYIRLFGGVEAGVRSHVSFLGTSFLPGLRSVAHLGSEDRAAAKLAELLRSLNASFASFEKQVLSSLRGSLAQVDEVALSAIRLRQSVAELNSKAYALIRECNAYENDSYNGRVNWLDSMISSLNMQLKAFEELSSLMGSTYSAGFLASSSNSEAYFVRETEKEIHTDQALLAKYVAHKDALVRFKQAYDAGDHVGMFNAAQGFAKKYELDAVIGSFSLHSPDNNLKAFAGVAHLQHDSSGHWANVPPSRIGDSEYAARLVDIMKNGYRPSLRRISLPILGVTDFNNIYFFPNYHDYYGEAVISWDCRGYCVFEHDAPSSAGCERIILTKKRLDPSRQALFLSPGLAQNIGGLLEKNGVSFKAVDLETWRAAPRR